MSNREKARQFDPPKPVVPKLLRTRLVIVEITNGSSLQPLSTGRPKQLVLLHGYGGVIPSLVYASGQIALSRG